MTGSELKGILSSAEFQVGLGGISCYLASIKQERPIVYLLASLLWKQRRSAFELEDKHSDLTINGKRIEFKFHYDRCEMMLAEELEKYGGDLEGMWQSAQEKEISESWAVMPRIYRDVCKKSPQPDIFVWIICSRDLSGVTDPAKQSRICYWKQQIKYHQVNPYTQEKPLPLVDEFLAKLNKVRPFTLLSHGVTTKGDFPSTYYFKICEFASS